MLAGQCFGSRGVVSVDESSIKKGYSMVRYRFPHRLSVASPHLLISSPKSVVRGKCEAPRGGAKLEQTEVRGSDVIRWLGRFFPSGLTARLQVANPNQKLD